MNYQEAVQILENPYTRNNQRKLANNTYLSKENGHIAVTLHGTDIIKFYPDHFILDSGGFRTMTTKDRINQFSPITFYQENFIWYYNDIVFFDGIQFDYDNNCLNPREDIVKNTHDMNKRIKEYTNKAMKALLKTIPLPGSGDCWYCHLKDDNNKTMGDMGDNSHLISHFDEEYIVPSLIYNAVEEAGYRYPMLIISGYNCNELTERGIMGGKDMMIESVKRAIRKYLQKRLLV